MVVNKSKYQVQRNKSVIEQKSGTKRIQNVGKNMNVKLRL